MDFTRGAERVCHLNEVRLGLLTRRCSRQNRFVFFFFFENKVSSEFILLMEYRRAECSRQVWPAGKSRALAAANSHAPRQDEGVSGSSEPINS